MRKTCKTVLCAIAGFGLMALTSGSTRAALIITDADVSANHYVYSLSFNDIGASTSYPGFGPASGTKFPNTIYSFDHLGIVGEGSGTGERRYVYAFGNSSTASLTYRFDFSGTNYRPTSVTFTDRVNVFAQQGNSVTATVAWSTNNIAYTTLRTDTRTTDFSFNDTTDVVPLSQESVIYYRVSFSSSANFVGSGVEWSRSSPASTPLNVADFTLVAVPEPASMALFGLAVVSGMFIRRR